MESNMVGWFEIPVEDMDRAKIFYEAVFQVKIQVQELGDTRMGWFPFKNGQPGAAGSLIQNKDWYTPSNVAGVLVYFNSEDVQNQLDRIGSVGGRILKPKTLISPNVGYMGLFMDSEGNRIALLSKK